MKKIDYETLFNYISLILAITIFGVIVYICYFKKNIEKFETENSGGDEGDEGNGGDEGDEGDEGNGGDGGDGGDDKEEVTAVGKAVVRNKKIKDIKIENAGKGYGSPPMIIITDSKGKNAQAVARIAYGSVTDIVILNGGEKYSQTPTITFESPKQAEANKNSVVPLGDKKETILELIENCNKLEREQKDKFKSRIENDALRKLEVEGLLSILNN